MTPIDLAQAALLVVDVQRGFSELCPAELPVPGALGIVPYVNRLLQLDWSRIDACQDWHPPDHRSFLGQSDHLYPPHCVAGTPGAEFLPGLETQRFHCIWRKGFDRGFEAYAVTAQHPNLMDLYRASGIRCVAVCGLATNICCFFAARDFRGAGFRTLIIEDASAGIDIPRAGLLQKDTKMQGLQLGIEYVQSQDLIAALR